MARVKRTRKEILREINDLITPMENEEIEVFLSKGKEGFLPWSYSPGSHMADFIIATLSSFREQVEIGTGLPKGVTKKDYLEQIDSNIELFKEFTTFQPKGNTEEERKANWESLKQRFIKAMDVFFYWW